VKLGTIANQTRDGQLVVVSRDLKRYTTAGSKVPTLQFALDNWNSVVAELQKLSDKLNNDTSFGTGHSFENFIAPLPRAYEWVDGSAYLNHVQLVRKARGAEMPTSFFTDPLVYQGGSGDMLAWNQDLTFTDASWGLDFESEVVVYLDDTPQATSAEEAQSHVRLVGIVNDVSLRGLIPNELAKGFGFFNSKPSTAFAPVVVTPDELGGAWQNGKVHLPLHTHYNGKLFGHPNAGPEMQFSFYELIAHITKTRSFTAGTILGSGTVSNEDRTLGSSCLAEKRMIETIDDGVAKTPFMQVGDRVEIEMFDGKGHSIFGKISQKVVPFRKG